MYKITDGKFAAAVSNAGGLGIIATGGLDLLKIKEEIRICKSLTNNPFGVNIYMLSPIVNEIVDLIIEEGIKIVTTGATSSLSIIKKLKEAKIMVFPVTSSVVLAKRMARYGVDGIIVEGMESGGHVGYDTTMSLVVQMKREIDWLTSTVQSQCGNHVIFYYSGHGVPAENQSTSYLLPKDGYAKNPTTGYDLADLYKELEKLDAESVVLLDACFSGTKKQGGMLVESKGIAVRQKIVNPSSRAITISACQGTESACVFEDQKHGMFTYFLLKKLQESKGKASVEDLYNYVKTNVMRTSSQIYNKQQTPSINYGSMVQDIKTKTLVP